MLPAHSGDQVAIPLFITLQVGAGQGSAVYAAPARILAAKERGQ